MGLYVDVAVVCHVMVCFRFIGLHRARLAGYLGFLLE
jgi:hypothetical protein